MFEQLDSFFNIIKGSFNPEQFSVFLNTKDDDLNGDPLTLFHETFHYWQSVFTPYGHLMWACSRDVSNEVIKLWLDTTQTTPHARKIPMSSMIPSEDLNVLSDVYKAYIQFLVYKSTLPGESIRHDPLFQGIIQNIEACSLPIIELGGQLYELNTIDIIEGYAKFQEAMFGTLLYDKPFGEILDYRSLNPEYYSALDYFLSKVDCKRILEFPAACEAAFLTPHMPHFTDSTSWQANHVAWRYIKIVDAIATLPPEDYLQPDNLQKTYREYLNLILSKCNFQHIEDCWETPIKYTNDYDLNIPGDMAKAITFIKSHPYALSYPLYNMETFLKMKDFHPYTYTTPQGSVYAVSSDSFGNEVIFETHYQAFAHQILGFMSERCIYPTMLQCGFSYYGFEGCKYLKDGSCDGHIDAESNLPKLTLDVEANLIDGCSFEAVMRIMGFSRRDLIISNTAKKIVFEDLIENIKRLKETAD